MTHPRFLIWSDLHEEFADLALPAEGPGDIDAILVAGDVWTKGRAVRRLERVADWAGVPIVLTPGNHDYYGTSMFKGDAYMARDAEASDRDIRFLNPGTTEVAGCRIIAAALWTDYRLRRPTGPNWLERNACEGIMNDHRRIRWGHGSFRPVTSDDLASVHLKHRDYIAHKLAEPFDGPTLVMTHHAPSEFSVRFRGREEVVDHAYASNLEGLILDHAPQAWVHGHTHNAEAYEIGSTRILSHPRGYPDQETGFDPLKVFEIDAADPGPTGP